MPSLTGFLTTRPQSHDSSVVINLKPDRPYFEAWLRRTGRQFRTSGRLTQTAVVLASEEGGSVDEWRTRLRTIMEGDEVPSLDLLIRIDGILAGPSACQTESSSQELLF